MSKSIREEYENVLNVMDKYYQAQKEGKSEILKPVCHKMRLCMDMQVKHY